MNGCEGCIHYDSCGYLDFDTSDLTEEEIFIEHCVGCCCGDCYDCNKGNGCWNWEDASGDLEQKILYLIKNRIDDDLYCISEKE